MMLAAEVLKKQQGQLLGEMGFKKFEGGVRGHFGSLPVKSVNLWTYFLHSLCSSIKRVKTKTYYT